jgi:hypothetical protein
VAVGGGALVGSLKCAHVSSCDISAVQEDPKLQEMAVALWDLQMQQQENQENKGDLSNLLIFFFWIGKVFSTVFMLGLPSFY